MAPPEATATPATAVAKDNCEAPTVVIYPSPGMGHLVSMIELAKLLVSRGGLRAIVVVLDPPFDTGSTAAFLDATARALLSSNISFHRLPPVPQSLLPSPPPRHNESLQFELIRLSDPALSSFLASLPSPPTALVLDFFCACTVDVADRLGIPSYIFFTSSASCLAICLRLPATDAELDRSFAELGKTPIAFPGVPPIPADHMSVALLHRDDHAYKEFVHIFRRIQHSAGIIVNTYDSLEHDALKALRDGLCLGGPGAPATMPPVLCVGPLVVTDRGSDGDAERDRRCLAWLDAQPRCSVVFLCFGSIGRFSAEQLQEVAAGLEASGQRFLWVVRSPPGTDQAAERLIPQSNPDLNALMPPGFLTRTAERGLVVASWAPQAAVLRHEAVGGFVTHLGWNSVLEAVCAGVPMVGWPLYAEQRMNRLFVADGMGLASAVEGYDVGYGLVSASEVERRVRALMVGEEGKLLRERVIKAKQQAEAALAEGGTSYLASEAVISLLTGKHGRVPTSGSCSAKNSGETRS